MCFVWVLCMYYILWFGCFFSIVLCAFHSENYSPSNLNAHCVMMEYECFFFVCVTSAFYVSLIKKFTETKKKYTRKSNQISNKWQTVLFDIDKQIKKDSNENTLWYLKYAFSFIVVRMEMVFV